MLSLNHAQPTTRVSKIVPTDDHENRPASTTNVRHVPRTFASLASCSPSHAVNVFSRIIGRVKLYNPVNSRNIQTSGLRCR
eukprot:COSAG02_NODE_4866_length_4884_cov_2782.941902_3_plen_81_part_00